MSASSNTVSAELHAGHCFLTIVLELFGNSRSGVSYTGQEISSPQFRCTLFLNCLRCFQQQAVGSAAGSLWAGVRVSLIFSHARPVRVVAVMDGCASCILVAIGRTMTAWVQGFPAMRPGALRIGSQAERSVSLARHRRATVSARKKSCPSQSAFRRTTLS